MQKQFWFGKKKEKKTENRFTLIANISVLIFSFEMANRALALTLSTPNEVEVHPALNIIINLRIAVKCCLHIYSLKL